MYTDINFKSKKALREAVAAGKEIGVFSPGPFGNPDSDATVAVEGPHYPKPHSWYATVTLANGIITKVR